MFIERFRSPPLDGYTVWGTAESSQVQEAQKEIQRERERERERVQNSSIQSRQSELPR